MKKTDHSKTILDGTHRTVLPGARAVGRVNPDMNIEVLLKLRPKKELPELNGRPAKVMTREEFASAYGASQADIDKVAAVLKKFGLTVTSTNTATRSVELSGPAESVEDAFGVKLFNYAHADGGYRGRTGDVHVPTELDGIVEGVFGLDTRRVARRRRQAADHALAASHNPSAWYKPAELAKHYNFPAGDGSGQTIGILEFGGGYFPSDLQGFCQLAGVQFPTVKTISVDGTSTSRKDGAEGEVMLDIEVVAGVCPKANIAVYFAHFSEKGWIKALDAVMQDHVNNPTVVSVSWGYAEDAYIWTKSAMTQVNMTLQQAAMLGITVCIAAGDDGSSDGEVNDGLAHADFPASSPYVLAVGGTTIRKRGSTRADITWFEGDGLRNDNGGSTGGGVSSLFPRPSWQSGININSVNPGAIVGRVLPDLAANADWTASPYLLFVDGSAQPNGGTSAATPLIASLVALINAQLPAGKRVGYLTPLLYKSASAGTVGGTCFADVTSGQNSTAQVGGYTARKGFDAVSGWGTPHGVKLLTALRGII
ncbi:MAG TPA: S53 family peptidase [Patescibacteria group bacterium]|nr:S53 family peptidase [Patescibacteria group bacterium]